MAQNNRLWEEDEPKKSSTQVSLDRIAISGTIASYLLRTPAGTSMSLDQYRLLTQLEAGPDGAAYRAERRADVAAVKYACLAGVQRQRGSAGTCWQASARLAAACWTMAGALRHTRTTWSTIHRTPRRRARFKLK